MKKDNNINDVPINEEEFDMENLDYDDYFEKIKSKNYFDIKDIQIDKEYYENLKKIDYTEVAAKLYITLEKYGDSLAEGLSYKLSEIDEYVDDGDIEIVESEAKAMEKTKAIAEMEKYGSPIIETIMLAAAYVLVLLQEPSLVNKFDLISNLKNSNLPKEVQEIILPYISDPVFQDSIFLLINKFEKDELLAFMVFGFEFNDFQYFNYAKKVDYFPINPLSNGMLKLLLNILDIKDNDEILNLYSNIGDFLIESFLYNPNIAICGSDSSHYEIPILKASLFSNNIKFENKAPLRYFENRIEQKADKIFLNLSLIPHYYKIRENMLGEIINDKEKVAIEYRNKFKNNFKIQNEILKDSSLEWLINILSINQLKDNGKAVALVERSILFDSMNRNIRKYFIENGFIESIIFLPTNTLITGSTSLVLIVFSKGNKKIKFIDAYNLGKVQKIKEKDINVITDEDADKILDFINNVDNNKISISKKIEDFVEKDYNLAITKNIEILMEISEESGNGVKFKDAIKNIMKGSQISANLLEEFRTNEKTSYIYLSLSDIDDGLIEFENIEGYLKKIPESQEKFCIKNNSILLSKYGISPYKLAVAQISNDIEIIPSGNFIIIEVDEKKLNPWYLTALFSSSLGSKILKKASTGINTLSTKKLEDIILQLPPIKEQEKIGEEYHRSVNEIKEIKKNLKKEIQNSREIFIKHNGGLV